MIVVSETISNRYIAGFFDGEGCISTQQIGDNKRVNKNRITKTYRRIPALFVVVGNTNKDVLQQVQQRFNGRMYSYDRSIKHYSTMHYWKASRHVEALEFLEKIYPYLIIKKYQAKLAIQFLKSRINHKVKNEAYSP